MFGFFKNKTSHYHLLREKWEKKHTQLQENLWTKHADALKQWGLGSLVGLVMLATAGPTPAAAPTQVPQQELQVPLDKKVFLIADLGKVLPQSVEPLTRDQEKSILEILSRNFNLNLFAEKDGIRLNRNYGYIGQEQLLPRYPGDTVDDHFSSSQDAAEFASYGMTPGLGAWGYFAPSKAALSEKDILREKYYIAAPTFLAPGYNENVKKFNTFFKYAKVLVVNPQNGKAIIADIADSGPSPWTGKHLGGSPAVMHYLDRVDGAQKGPVLYFFIDDPNDSVPLGPISI